VYFTDGDLLQRATSSDAHFVSLLAKTQHLDWHRYTPCYQLRKPVFGLPAHTVQMVPPVGEGWTAVGDAAIACDPLSSQGLLTALFTGLTGGRAIHECLSGNVQAIEGYRQRLALVFQQYWQNRTAYYALENRWPEHAFWLRRQYH